MSYLELIIGATVGFVSGMVVKNMIISNNQNQSTALKRQLDAANQQLLDLKGVDKKLKEEIDQRNSEIQFIREKARDKEDESDDREDELEKVKQINKHLISENEDFKRKLEELEILYESKKRELESINKQ
jgi:predicted small secreted protein